MANSSGWDVPRATRSLLVAPKGAEGGSICSGPEGSSKGQRERHSQMCASDFWKSLKLSAREQLH